MKVSRMRFATIATIAAALILLVGAGAEPVLAHGDSHRSHQYAGHGSARSGPGYGYGRGYGRGYGFAYGSRRHSRGQRRHRYGGGVYFSARMPLYASAGRETVLVQERQVRASRPAALPNMPTLMYTARAGQDAAALTRDRRECERRAWRQTRPDPRGVVIRSVHTESVVVARGAGTNILYPAANGAALGAIGGAIGGDIGAGAAIGALVGATSWLLSGAAAPRHERVEREVHRSEYVPAAGPDPRALRETLRNCMQSRDYTVQ